MELIWYLIVLAVTGLIIGAVARLLVPGPNPMGIGATILVGIAGSFTAGLLTRALVDDDTASWLGVALAVLVAALLVVLLTRGARSRTGV